MHSRNCIFLISAALVLCVAVFLIAPPINAYVIQQMDDVYLNETDDISQALAWPSYSIAWCSPSNYDCTPPDQVINITGNMHKVYIDPAVYKLGTYYRWDGTWHRGENQDAFYVHAGTRPLVNVTEVPVVTPTSTPSPGIDASGNGPFKVMVARGDNPPVTIRYYADTDPGDGHLWLFGSNSEALDITMKREGYNYTWTISAANTEAMAVGTYTGYLQFPGKNGLQDVFYVSATKTLDTPYDNAIVPDVSIGADTPQNAKGKFENLEHTAKYADDTLIPITMEVKSPEIVVDNVIQGYDGLHVSGHTSWSNGTTLTVKLDPDNYKLGTDVRLHTWTTIITGGLGGYRAFDTAVPLDTTELYIGTHEIKLTVDKNGYTTDTFHNFRITDVYVMPTPTPQLQKVILDAQGNPIPMITQITPVPTALPTTVTSMPTTVPIVNVTENVTEIITTVTTEPTPIPTEVIEVPLPWGLAVCGIVGGVLWKKRK